MKKMTFIAALLGVTHFSNAQVGIGTATPAEAAQLEISAINKGVLIPRVELRNTTTFGPVTGTEVESLLVYNTETIADVTPGFYYWVKESAATPHWERIVNQTQLDEAIANITDVQADLAKVIALLKVAFPANNLVDPAITGDTHGGGMVFTPGATPTIEYVYFDGTDYVKKDITADIIDLITGNETKTKLVTINNVQYYVSESYTGTADPTTGTEPGVYKIDVVGGIINNFEEFVTNNPVTIDNNTYTTVEEYIQYISENAMQDGVTKIVIDATTNQASFQRWDKTTNTWVNVDNSAFETIVTDNETVTTMTENADGTYTYKNEAGADVVIDIPASVIQELGDIIEGTTTFNNSTATTLVEYIQNMIDNTDLPAGTVTAEIVSGNIVFSIIDANGVANVVPSTAFNNIVKANETETEINKNTTGTAAGGDVEITYDYFNETSGSTAQATIDLTTDIQNLIEGNTDIQNAITNILNEGGNVYYGDHDDDAGTPNIFYTIVNGTKTPIDISEVVVNAITNATNVQKQEIKNQLGDNFENTTVVNTGDTWIDGGKIYRGIFDATVTGGSANVSAITLTGGTIGNVIGIKILNATTNQIINTATTDVTLATDSLTFRIGTGNMYNVLSDVDLDIKVIVEYSVTQ
ncbi:hypothetical protein SAMN02927937_00531 [Paenimyroides aquimaris]|uniref:Uncharacterized protein n=1 Tax=Paenimyroides marinum TaxID=1159016 RepID=A0A1H6JMH3_9FLAO|nr:hypothetical protein [Paenimyroides aquimaris]SEH62066.1 hypothetical protein SAMN02927937_00531 [Paenimyroides aquimaris]